MSKLTLADIADNRAYEREREVRRSEVIALKKVRRIGIGPFVTVVFENATTMRFQVQEMARAERMTTDAQIQAELDAYNPLIPAAGELSATLFLELTNTDDLREWLPKLVGIERALELRVGPDCVVAGQVEEEHAAQLTRQEVTSSVHYVKFVLSAGEQELLQEAAKKVASDLVSIAVAHPQYRHSTALGPGTLESLVTDLVESGSNPD